MWRRLLIAWACIIALALAAGTASAASSAPAKPHQGTSEFSAALNVCAFVLATVEANTGNRCLSTARTSDVPYAARALPSLTAKQSSNLARFTKKLPKGAEPVTIRELPGGGRAFQSSVPGRVPGSFAQYEKQVDAAGKTIGYTKTTVDPAGNIVHVKDKLTGAVFNGGGPF
jgi:hypothetical protein